MDPLEDAVSGLLRKLGVTAVSNESGRTIATAAPSPLELAPLSGYGDTVARGDLVRVYYVEGLLRRQRPATETLVLDRVVVTDYDADGAWMVVVPEAGLKPASGPTSFQLRGPGSRSAWRRRLELVRA
jgi:hypothetical protein